jgi:hypothetical protein
MDEQQHEHLTQMLLSQEDRAWQALSRGAGADFYQGNLTPDALMVFPFGILDRDAAIAALRAAPPWATYRLSDPHKMAFGRPPSTSRHRSSRKAGIAGQSIRLCPVDGDAAVDEQCCSSREVRGI